jgi:hypothetical protein
MSKRKRLAESRHNSWGSINKQAVRCTHNNFMAENFENKRIVVTILPADDERHHVIIIMHQP